MTDYDFEETYMSLTKKELVKVIKRKINEALKYKEMWEHRGERIDLLLSRRKLVRPRRIHVQVSRAEPCAR